MMRSQNICIVIAAILISGISILPAVQSDEPGGGVTLAENETSFVRSNGIVTARILKSDGDIRSLSYKGTELLTDKSGHPGGHWSHDTTGGADRVAAVTIDPAENGGSRAEVSIGGISGGIKMGHGPGAAPDGDFPNDSIESLHQSRGGSVGSIMNRFLKKHVHSTYCPGFGCFTLSG